MTLNLEENYVLCKNLVTIPVKLCDVIDVQIKSNQIYLPTQYERKKYRHKTRSKAK